MSDEEWITEETYVVRYNKGVPVWLSEIESALGCTVIASYGGNQIAEQAEQIKQLQEAQEWRPIRCEFDEQDYTNDIPDFSNAPVLYRMAKRFGYKYVYADRVDDEGKLYHDQEMVGTIFEAAGWLPLPPEPKGET